MSMKAEEKNILNATCENLGSLLDFKGKEVLHDPLLPFSALHAACVLIGKSMKFDFKFPSETLHDEMVEEKIDRIARCSGVDYRSIDLRSIIGVVSPIPLLAFYGDNKTPVVLHLKAKGCVLQDPSTHETFRLNGRDAQKLEPLGYEFYRPFVNESNLSFIKMAKTLIGYHMHEAWIALSAGLLFTLASLFFPFALKVLFDTVMRSGDISFLYQLSLGVVAALASSALFMLVQRYTISRLRTMTLNDMQLGIWGKVFRSSTKILKKFTVGEIFEKIDYFARNQQVIGEQAITALINAFYSLFYFGVMLYFSIPFALGALAFVAVSLIITYFFVRVFIKLQQMYLPLDNKLVSKVVQFIRGIRTIRVTDTESRFFASWANSFIPTQKLQAEMGYKKTWFTCLIKATPMLITFMIYAITVIRFERGETSIYSMTIGDFIAFIYALNSFVQATYGSLGYYFEVLALVPSWNQAKEVLEIPPENTYVAPSLSKLTGNISIDNVYFSYNEERSILNGAKLRVDQGEFIGIIGPTGSGKSTLLRLLLGLEVPVRGNITYDSRDLTEWDLKDLRKQIGTVLQNSTIFEGSILENITVGRRIEKEKIDEVIKSAGLETFITELPMGLLTRLSYGGTTISMGQKQRILIARALVDDPKVLLFDEATSALDNLSQEIVIDNLENMKITRIVVAHRPTTLRKADRIFSIEGGVLLEKQKTHLPNKR